MRKIRTAEELQKRSLRKERVERVRPAPLERTKSEYVHKRPKQEYPRTNSLKQLYKHQVNPPVNTPPIKPVNTPPVNTPPIKPEYVRTNSVKKIKPIVPPTSSQTQKPVNTPPIKPAYVRTKSVTKIKPESIEKSELEPQQDPEPKNDNVIDRIVDDIGYCIISRDDYKKIPVMTEIKVLRNTHSKPVYGKLAYCVDGDKKYMMISKNKGTSTKIYLQDIKLIYFKGDNFRQILHDAPKTNRNPFDESHREKFIQTNALNKKITKLKAKLQLLELQSMTNEFY